MVATTFSTDTPNLVTNLVREHGVANNWAWWAFLLTGMMTVFFYARLWRRSGVLTDLEFYDIRYSGRAATFVRRFRAVYLGLAFNCFIMATVNLAAVKIASIVLGWPEGKTLVICTVVSVFFAATSGLWGVLVTDFIQFGIAMTGSVATAYFALKQPEVGGLANLIARTDPKTLALLPDFSDWGLTLTVLVDSAHGAVVVGLVPRRRARGRQLHRPAHARVEVGEGRIRRHVVLQLRALRACGHGRGSSSRSRR